MTDVCIVVAMLDIEDVVEGFVRIKFEALGMSLSCGSQNEFL